MNKRVIVSTLTQQGVGGVTVSIVAFQAVDPGSTPGQRRIFFPLFTGWGVDKVHYMLIRFLLPLVYYIFLGRHGMLILAHSSSLST